MLESHKSKQLTKNEALQKVEAWKAINSVLVQQSSSFMNSLASMLTEKQVQHEQLKCKLEDGNGTDDDNAEYLYLGGYIQCLKDVLGARQRG